MATLPKVLISRADYQIGGGVALGLRTQALAEPAVDRSEPRLIPLALIAPEPRHARCRAEFPGFWLLLARNRKGSVEIRFPLCLRALPQCHHAIARSADAGTISFAHFIAVCRSFTKLQTDVEK